MINHAFGSLSGHSSLEDPISFWGAADVINHDLEARGRPAEPPLSIFVHFVNNFLRKLFTFCCLGSSPRFPLPDPGSDPAQMLLVLITHFLRKLFTFVDWAPFPRLPFSDPGSDPSQIMLMLFTSS